MTTLLSLAAVLLLIWFVGAFLLGGNVAPPFPMDAKAAPFWQRFSTGPTPNAEHAAVVAALGTVNAKLAAAPRSQHLHILREHMEGLAGQRVFSAEFRPALANGVAAEWVLAPGADPARRILYIHGGACMLGSPRSLRAITTRFSEVAGAAVLAIDYRLLPEHTRRDGIEDCRSAYQWMLGNGPDGAAAAAAVYVAGDSAGGNLALSLLAWVRDQGLRAPNAAVALSPATDATLGSASLRSNVASDAMLGPLFGRLLKVPRSVLLWGAWWSNRMRPNDPVISPLMGNLAGLAPLLIHASAIEMLRDDSLRYA
ncbi:MAG: alpha/beta hydrolase fold domain-containing protein, partial [Rhodoferax sp.]